MSDQEQKKVESVLRCLGLNTTNARQITAMIEDPAQDCTDVVEQVIEYNGDN